MTISEQVEVLVTSLGDLGPEASVYAAVARRLAEALDDRDVAPYALDRLSRELRAAVVAVTGSPDTNAPGLDDAEFDEFLRGLR